MRKVTMVRLGIAAAITALGAIGAGASGCTSDDSSTNPSDAGNGSDSPVTNPDGGGPPPGDGGPTPDGVAPDSGPPAVDAKLIVVHAAPGLGPVRLCFAITSGGTSTVANTAALPDNTTSAPPYLAPPSFLADGGTAVVAQGTPGIYPGTIGAFPDITSLQKTAITPYLIDATLVAGQRSDGGTGDGGVELTCQQLVGLHGLGTAADNATLTADQFTTLPTIPSQTFLDNHTYLLSLTGCVGSFAVSATATAGNITAANICGADWVAGTGNVAVGIAPIDSTSTPADGGWGVQFAHRSTMLEGTNLPVQVGPSTFITHGAASTGLAPGFVTTTLVDAGDDAAAVPTEAFLPLGAPVKTGGTQITAYSSVSVDPTSSDFAVVTTPGSLPDGGTVFLPWPVSVPPGGDAPIAADLIAVPLNVIQLLSGWAGSTATSPTTYAPGTGFTFVILGSAVDVAQLTTSNPDGGTTPVQNPAYDGRGLHVVAFPNVFTAIPQN